MEDYSQLRTEFLENYPDIQRKLKLNDKLKQLVANYAPTKIWQSMQNCSEETQKDYILLELTKTRHSCDEVILMLYASGNIDLANELADYNKSPGHKDIYGFKERIVVTPSTSTSMKAPNSNNYSMSKKPRGRALIVNNDRRKAGKESERFRHVFRQLYFEVDVHYDQTCRQIKELLVELKNDLNQRHEDDEEDEDQALIVMIITHGQNEQVKGHRSCTGDDPSDQMDFNEVVDTIGGLDYELVKMFFFNCCRVKTPEDKHRPFKHRINTADDTFIFYSCAESYKTPGGEGFTLYGKTLSESIAQYACDRDLIGIMNKTVQVMRSEWELENQEEEYGIYLPEHNSKAPQKKLYFNPGCFRDENDEWVYEDVIVMNDQDDWPDK